MAAESMSEATGGPAAVGGEYAAVSSVRCRGGRSFDWQPQSSALLVIDMQRDFLDHADMSATAGEDVTYLRAVMPTVQAVTAAARAAGLRIIHTREGYGSDLGDVNQAKLDRDSVGRSGPLGRFLIRGEAGHDFAEGFAPRPEEAVIDKAGFSAFHRTGLHDLLAAEGVTHLILVGITTQCCVHSTLRSAVDLGYYCLTVADGCAAFDPDVHDAALKLIEAEGHLFGWIADAADVIEAMRD